jgi:hypothetical protein
LRAYAKRDIIRFETGTDGDSALHLGDRSSFSKREEILCLAHTVGYGDVSAKLAPEIGLAYQRLIVEFQE